MLVDIRRSLSNELTYDELSNGSEQSKGKDIAQLGDINPVTYIKLYLSFPSVQ